MPSLQRVGNVVGGLFEKYVDVRPGEVTVIPQTHQPVVDDDQIQQSSRNHEEDSRGCDDTDTHACLLALRSDRPPHVPDVPALAPGWRDPRGRPASYLSCDHCGSTAAASSRAGG